MNNQTRYVNDATHEEVRAPKNGRGTLEIVNTDNAVIYFSEDCMATPENGKPIAANTSIKYGKDSEIAAVPQGSIWILGSALYPLRQRVIIREG
jgi:hypothetical protein